MSGNRGKVIKFSDEEFVMTTLCRSKTPMHLSDNYFTCGVKGAARPRHSIKANYSRSVQQSAIRYVQVCSWPRPPTTNIRTSACAESRRYKSTCCYAKQRERWARDIKPPIKCSISASLLHRFEQYS